MGESPQPTSTASGPVAAATSTQERVMRPHRTSAQRDADHSAGWDNDTVDHGTGGPFDYWESDHTALVHVLGHAKHEGLSLDKDADRIATLIKGSRWHAASRHEAVLRAATSTGEQR